MFQSIKNVGKVLLGISVLASGGYSVYGSVQKAVSAKQPVEMEIWQQTDAAGNLIPGTEVEVENQAAASTHFECSPGPDKCAVRLNPDGSPSSTYLTKS